MWEASKWLYKSCRWRIGDDNLVRLWTNPWVPKHRSLVELYLGDPEDIKVSNIITDDGGWDTELINSIFHPRLAGDILKIRLGPGHHRDCWIWGEDKSGKFSVHNAYKAFFNLHKAS